MRSAWAIKYPPAEIPACFSRRESFDSESHDWPNRATSRFVATRELEWHVQDSGCGPPLLLVHGTGSASHSWRDVAPLLARRFRVIVPDLPGHGYTSAPAFAGFTLPSMAASVRDLLYAMGATPCMVAGHSAGAAVMVSMALSQYIAPRVLISINGALLPLTGVPRWVFSPMAKLLARSPLVPQLVARRAANRKAIERLIADTGSKLDPAGIRLYQRLVRQPSHVAAALSMMANWDLESLARDIPKLRVPLKLLAASNDRTISAADAQRVRALVPSAEVIRLDGLGHLAHEESPQLVADEIVRIAVEAGVLSSRDAP